MAWPGDSNVSCSCFYLLAYLNYIDFGFWLRLSPTAKSSSWTKKSLLLPGCFKKNPEIYTLRIKLDPWGWNCTIWYYLVHVSITKSTGREEFDMLLARPGPHFPSLGWCWSLNPVPAVGEQDTYLVPLSKITVNLIKENRCWLGLNKRIARRWCIWSQIFWLVFAREWLPIIVQLTNNIIIYIWRSVRKS